MRPEIEPKRVSKVRGWSLDRRLSFCPQTGAWYRLWLERRVRSFGGETEMRTVRDDIRVFSCNLDERRYKALRVMNETDDKTTYRVVLNHEEQYAIWPAHKK